MTCSIWVDERAGVAAAGPLALVRARISIVSSASQSPVSTSIGPPSTISRAADRRSP